MNMINDLFGISINFSHIEQTGGSKDDDNVENDPNNDKSIEDMMLENYSYPSPSQENFQESIYVKREFYINAIPDRGKIDPKNRMTEYRKLCNPPKFKLSPTQILLSNFINPNTPFKGVLINHGTGVGKSCAAIAIGEKFKPMVEKYGTRIHVLVPGPINKQNFISEILKCTGETYFKYFIDKTVILNEAEIAKNKKNATNIINKYYRVMSYRSFYKKVLGEKIREKIVTGNKIKISNRKTSTGEYERDLSLDRIYNLDNSLLIIDEAHNITGNEYGYSVKKIIEKSKNLRIVLLTATPMKNLADAFVELINFLRPKNHQMERDKIYTSQKTHLMEFKPNGKEYLRKMVRGYVSYLRGADPLTFGERIDMGEIAPGLDFTRVIRCWMLPFQLEIYNEVVEKLDDSLDRSSEAVANFAFPGLSKNGKKIVGYYGIEGMNDIRNQLKSNSELICKKIATEILGQHEIADPSSLMYLAENGRYIRGDIYSEQYLKYFSIKFYTALRNINDTVYGKREPGLLFVYSNLVRAGIDIFQEILQHNGYLEYQEDLSNYNIKKNTRCYCCPYTYDEHDDIPDDIPEHEFYPATYVTVTGKSEENNEQIPEEKHRILNTIFNNPNNSIGKYIKIVIGSKVMNEGITLKNIKEIHILDVHYTLGKIDQVIGRGIRYCTHVDIINEENQYPKVEIYKYVVSVKDKMSSEENLYRKAELKYKLVKETERILQEEAIDCPLNRNGNIFEEEIERYKNCGSKDNPCPTICGYMPCEFMCSDKSLNLKYYDPDKHSYRKLKKSELDYSTYNNSLASEEIEIAKSKIKDMYRINHVYELEDIIKYIRKTFPEDKRDMFDDYYVYQGLDELIPITGNDFNNYHDTIVDKFNRPGYLIYRNRYYIFQPFDENEDLPMYYRRHHKPLINNRLNLKNYIHNSPEYLTFKTSSVNTDKQEVVNKTVSYDFLSNQEYYDSRDEFKYVGAIDQDSLKKNKKSNEIKDTFKIRESRPKVIEKKRQAGIPTYKGAECATSKDKRYLNDVAKTLNIKNKDIDTRDDVCKMIRDKMFDMEKYATTKDNNKITYLIVPSNHPNIPFPLNLEDRVKYIINKIKRETRNVAITKIDVTNLKSGKYDDIKYVSYRIYFDESMNQHSDIMKKYGATQIDNLWTILVE